MPAPAPAPEPVDSETEDAESDPEDAAAFLGEDEPYLTVKEAFEVVYKVSTFDTHPKSFAEAMQRPDAQMYYDAAVEEMQTLIDNHSWELVKLPPGRKAIGSRWVFRIKHKAEGSIERYKARLVAKGYGMRPGFDYVETFAPTAKWAALRAVLAIAALEDMEIESLDISSAFLNGVLDTEVFMEQPEGFPLGAPDEVLLLKRGPLQFEAGQSHLAHQVGWGSSVAWALSR